MTSIFSRHLPAKLLRAMAFALGAGLLTLTTAATCSDSVDITFVNTTSSGVNVYKSEDPGDFLTYVPPDSKKEITVVEKYWKGQIVLRRDEVIFRSESLSWQQLSEHGDNFEYVITNIDG